MAQAAQYCLASQWKTLAYLGFMVRLWIGDDGQSVDLLSKFCLSITHPCPLWH